MTQPPQIHRSTPSNIRQDTSTPASALRICIGRLEEEHVGRKVRLYGRCVEVGWISNRLVDAMHAHYLRPRMAV